MTELPEAIAEALQERWWRFRCGEPDLDHYPIRCRRNLGHPTPHVGLGPGPIVWDGVGNSVSAQAGGPEHYRCWGHCTARGTTR